MRIIHIIPTLQKGGAERLALDICTQLQGRIGEEVMLVVLNNSVQYDVSENIKPVVTPSWVKLSV